MPTKYRAVEALKAGSTFWVIEERETYSDTWKPFKDQTFYASLASAERVIDRLESPVASCTDNIPEPPRPDIQDWSDPKKPKPGIDDWYFDKVAADAFNEDFHKEVYHSQTHGYIKLSFTGRRLLANLRFAIQDAISAQDYSFNDKAVAKARGDLATYMHQMEGKQVNLVPKPFMQDLSTESLKNELARRGEYFKSINDFSTARLYEELGLRIGL